MKKEKVRSYSKEPVVALSPKKTDKALEKKPGINSDVVKSAEYYHGLIPRVDAEALLVKEGDFLLRKTEYDPKKGNLPVMRFSNSDVAVVLALTVRISDTACRHFMVNLDSEGFLFEGHSEKTIPQLISWHIETKTPLSAASGVIIKRPIERSPWLLNHDCIAIVKKLGEGAFGEVFLAEYEAEGYKQEVAVKTMRVKGTKEARNDFIREARLMKKFSHKNVIKVFGVALHEQPVMIAMEYCARGSLLNYLTDNKGKTTKADKLRFCCEAADGLAYLEKMNCLHRDIAARNCLLGNKEKVKISDFGMSTGDNSIISDLTIEKVPIKWLAPESMQEKIFSIKTDVWAFGILLYEIYSEGGEPYPGMSNAQTRAKVVLNDYRMTMPEDTPKLVVDITANCWNVDPSVRSLVSVHGKALRELYELENPTKAKKEKDCVSRESPTTSVSNKKPPPPLKLSKEKDDRKSKGKTSKSKNKN